MEKDSFEDLLKAKILRAELETENNLGKEKVWNAIQKKDSPAKWAYYITAAAMLLVLITGVLFFNKNAEKSTIVKRKQQVKPLRDTILRPKSIIEDKKLPVFAKSKGVIKPVFPEQHLIAEQIAKQADPIQLPKQTEILASPITAQVQTAEVQNPIIIPEFTVQFKRGTSIANHTDENIMTTTLKKFKLKRDTTYFANAVEKLPIKIKLTFKKEN